MQEAQGIFFALTLTADVSGNTTTMPEESDSKFS